jgi:hypothetical protein
MSRLEKCYGPSIVETLEKLRMLVAHDPPPIFRVIPATADPGDILEKSSVRWRRLTHSGAIELLLPGPGLNRGLAESVLEHEGLIHEILLRDDERRVGGRGVVSLSEGPRIVPTLLNLGGDGTLPALGPGGHVALHETADGIQIDILTRRRTEALRARWRSPEAVAEDLFLGFGVDASTIAVGALTHEFGYFELSKYEGQNVLRPAVVVRLDVPGGEERVPLRVLSVAAASAHPDLDAAEGLGTWSSAGGV